MYKRRFRRELATFLALVALAGTPAAQFGRDVIRGKNVGGSDTLVVKEATNDFRLENVELQASPRTTLMFFDHKGPYVNTVLRNVLIHVAPGTITGDRAYWGVRGYDMIDTLFDNVEITGYGKVTPKHDEGHAIYLNLAGDLDIDGCYIHHNGGQGIQLVNRPKETAIVRGPAPGTITIRNTRLHENGFNPDRGGFQLSIFGTGQAIRLENVEIVAGFDATRWPKDKTGGGLVIEAEIFVPNKKPVWWRPANVGPNFVPPFTQGPTVLDGVTIRHRDPNRAIAQIKGCKDLLVTRCTFEGGRVDLDNPEKSGRTCGTISWFGNLGDAEVWVRGERIGVATDAFVIDADGKRSEIDPDAGRKR